MLQGLCRNDEGDGLPLLAGPGINLAQVCQLLALSAFQSRVDGLAQEDGFEFAFCTGMAIDRKSTRLNSSHVRISYAVFCLKKKKAHNCHSECRFRHTPIPDA